MTSAASPGPTTPEVTELPGSPWSFAEPRPDEQPLGFLTDMTLCIGCKACEVACKQWNQLPADGMRWTGHSLDNTAHLGSETWRHVKFLEDFGPDRENGRFVFMSDVCKHCTDAGCLNACPTGAIIRTEFDTVYVQDDICNGCGYCVPACPFGVIGRSEVDGGAHKCTMCYDREREGIEPACAKSCPTDSIIVGPVDEIRRKAAERVADLQRRGLKVELWGDSPGLAGGLNSMFILNDEPERLGLPRQARTGKHNLLPSYAGHVAVGLAWLAVTAVAVARARR